MAKQTSKDQLLKDIHTERRHLENLLSSMSAEAMEQTGVTGNWSVKDILAHLVAWEKLFLDWYQAGNEGRSPAIDPVGMSRTRINALNQEIYRNNKDRHLEEVLGEFHTSYQQVIDVITAIPQEGLFAHDRFEWTGSLTLADYVAGNTCNHYAWAAGQIRKHTKRGASLG